MDSRPLNSLESALWCKNAPPATLAACAYTPSPEQVRRYAKEGKGEDTGNGGPGSGTVGDRETGGRTSVVDRSQARQAKEVGDQGRAASVEGKGRRGGICSRQSGGWRDHAGLGCARSEAAIGPRFAVREFIK